METPVLQTPSKTHTWILVLLVWVIALLLFVAGYMIYRDQSNEGLDVATEGAQTSCSEEIADAIKAYQDGKGDEATAAPACPTTDSYAIGIGPSFDYPITWEVFAQAIEGRSATIIRLSEEPLWLCEGCDGPGNPIDIEVYGNTTEQSLDAYVASRYSVGNGYVSTTKGTTTINGASVLRVKGQYNGMWSGPFEDIVYVTDTTIVVASMLNSEGDTSIDAAWEVVKNSLDFSEME